MPPKSNAALTPSARRPAAHPQSTGAAVWNEALKPENRAVLRAIGIFAAGVAFLASPLREYLLVE